MNDNSASSKKMIFICDDNAALVALMQHLLRKRGFSVMTAGDGTEGLELLRSTVPDLLLLDLAMPGVDGLAVLKGLQGMASKAPYTIVVSGQEGKDMREQATALGANEVWKKPFNAADLIGRIEGLITEGTI